MYLSNYKNLLTSDVQAHLNTSPDGTCDVSDDCVTVREYNTSLLDLQATASDVTVSKIWISTAASYATFGAAGVKLRMLIYYMKIKLPCDTVDLRWSNLNRDSDID